MPGERDIHLKQVPKGGGAEVHLKQVPGGIDVHLNPDAWWGRCPGEKWAQDPLPFISGIAKQVWNLTGMTRNMEKLPRKWWRKILSLQ